MSYTLVIPTTSEMITLSGRCPLLFQLIQFSTLVQHITVQHITVQHY